MNLADRGIDFYPLRSGRRFYPLDLRPGDFCIEDVARGLSRHERFGGHATRFYSTAQHCYLLSEMVPPEYAMDALLHDAALAYPCDLNNVDQVQTAMSFGLGFDVGTETGANERRQTLRDAHNLLVMAEYREMFPAAVFSEKVPKKMRELVPYIDFPLWERALAESMFLIRYNELKDRAVSLRQENFAREWSA